MANDKGVIITVHVETRNLRSDCWKNDRINPTTISLKNRVCKTRGYDRRAQLLAYAQQLRHAHAHQLPFPTFNNSTPKLNKWSWGVAMEKIRRFIMRFDGTEGKHKYESIVVEDYSDDERSCKQETMNKDRKGRTRRRYPHFCKKLRRLLKKISKAWKCKLLRLAKLSD